jgi:hypothetical protein
MSTRENQSFWVPSGVTVRLPPRMRLARPEKERLWKGLERFVNCGDSESDYKALGRAFPDFWPVEIWHYPKQGPPTPAPVLGRIVSDAELSEEEGQTESLAWNAVCHALFLFYRDTLREVWYAERSAKDGEDLGPTWRDHEFLLGLTNYNEEALKAEEFSFNCIIYPPALDRAWGNIRRRFPMAAVEDRVEISVLWETGDLCLIPHNDFQRAFYFLFRQNWRARVCPRCKMFFAARKPKQRFCGTGCSAGSRLASKRKWWKRVGAKRRAPHSEGSTHSGSKKKRTGRPAVRAVTRP